MSEKRRKRAERIERVGEIIATGGLGLVSGRRRHPETRQSNDGPVAPITLTKEMIKEHLGFELAVYFPHWKTDAAGVLEFHEELNRLGGEQGWQNVIGSLYQDTESEELMLGVFVKPDAAK